MRIFLTLLLLALPMFASAQVVITEIFYNPEGSESGQEFVEIFNNGTESVDLSGAILNIDNSHKECSLEVASIDAGEYLVLNNDNLEPNLTLYNASGAHIVTLFDTVEYSANDGEEGESLQRQLDDTWVAGTPTPGGGPFSLESNDNNDSSTTTIQTEVITTEVIQYDTVTIEPPQDIHLRLSASEHANTGTYVRFSVEVYDATGSSVHNPNVQWSFGDGTTERGLSVKHRYKYAGEYAVSVYVKSGCLTDELTQPIIINDTNVSLRISDSYDFVEIVNNSSESLDISHWKLRSGYKYFYIPERTIILPSKSIRLSNDITKLTTLTMEKRAFLYDAGQALVADSSEYTEPSAQEESATTTLATESSSTPLVATQDSSGTWRVAQVAPATSIITPLGTTEALQSEYNDLPAQAGTSLHQASSSNTKQLAAAVVSTGGFTILSTGAQWLLGLLAVIVTGVLALGGLLPHNAIAKGTESHVDDFEITEIK